MTSPTPGLEAPTHVRWRILALLMGLCLISHVNRAAMSVAGTDRIMDQYGIDPTRMGTIYSTFLLIYSLCMIPGGILIDRFGPRRALIVVGFGSALFGALTGMAGWFLHTGASLLLTLAIVRGTMGLVSAPLHPAAARGIASWFPYAQRSWANGLVTAAAIAGVALTYPCVGALITAVDWPGAFLICAGVTVALTLGWTYYARDQAANHPGTNAAERRLIADGDEPASGVVTEPSIRHWSELLGNGSLLLLTFCYAAVGYFQYLFVYWMQYYFEKVLHFGPMESKYYAGFLQVGLAFGMPLGGWLSGRLARTYGVRRGRAFVSGGGMVLSAFLLGLGLLAREPLWIVAWFALAHVAIGASEGPIWATAVDIGGRQGGTAAAICNTGGNLGGLLAPVVTPWIGRHLGWPWGIGLGGVICFLGALSWCWIDPKRRGRTSSPD